MTPARLITAAAVLALAACGSPPASTAQPAASPTATAPATPAAAVTASSVAPSATPGPAKFGTPYRVLGDNVEAAVTAFAYRQPTAKSAPKPSTPNTEWASVDAQVCIKTATGDVPFVNNSPWLLIYADGTSVEPSNIIYNQFDSPAYPSGDRDLPAGRCVRGWITFAAPAGQRAVMVEYQRRNGVVYDWATS